MELLPDINMLRMANRLAAPPITEGEPLPDGTISRETQEAALPGRRQYTGLESTH